MAQRIFELIFKGSTSALESASKNAVDALDKVGDEMDDVAEKAGHAAKETAEMGTKLYDTAEAGGSAEQAFNGITDLMSVMTEQFGISLGPVTEYTGALAQVGGGVEALLKGGPAFIQSMVAMTASVWAQVTALYAQAAAFVVANAPLLLIIAGIALLAAGIVLLITHWDDITARVPILGTAFEAVKGVVLGVVGALTGAFQSVLDFVTNNWPLIATLLSGPFAPIVLLATDAFGVRSAIVGAVQGILSWVTEHWQVIATIISGPFIPIVLLATDAFGVRSALTGAVSSMISEVAEKASDILNAGKALGSAMLDGIKDGLSGTVGFVTAVGGELLSALKTMVNAAIIDPINRALEFHIGGSILGKDWGIDINPPDIPHLASGGIVTRPTLALIGEAGPEAVIPLSAANRSIGTGVTVEQHNHFNGFVGDVGELLRRLDLEARRSGQRLLAPA